MVPPLSVLVVEDQVDVAESTAELLTLSGYDVRVATGGSEALNLAAVKQPDVVLLDINMPRMNGWDVARRLRGLAGKAPFVIALTVYSSDLQQEEAETGITMFLVKPVPPAVLLGVLAKICSVLSQPTETPPDGLTPPDPQLAT